MPRNTAIFLISGLLRSKTDFSDIKVIAKGVNFEQVKRMEYLFCAHADTDRPHGVGVHAEKGDHQLHMGDV